MVFANWRGLVASPGLPAETVAELTTLVERLRESRRWQEAIARHRWADSYLPGDGFRDFLTDEQARVAQVLRDLGLRPAD